MESQMQEQYTPNKYSLWGYILSSAEFTTGKYGTYYANINP